MKKWVPKVGEEYWFIEINHLFNVWTDNWWGDFLEVKQFEAGNVFKTKEEAEYELERRKVYRELRNCSSKEDEQKFYILYDYSDKCIRYVYDKIYKYSDIYFKSFEDAEKAVESVGKDRILKYYLGVKE